MNLKTSIRRVKPRQQANGQSVRRSEQTKLEEAFLLQKQLLATRDYAEAIIEAVPPLLVLDKEFRVLTANASFCKCFKVSQRQTLNRPIYELGNRQWDIPELRSLLEKVLPRKSFFKDFEMTHEFKSIGRRTMLLSGRQVDHLQKILLFIEDITERRESQAAIRTSEIRYRRLFEAARDGILILDPATRKITDANPFMSELLGYPHTELLGKELWEIGLLKDEKASQAAFRELRKNHFIRYEDLPLQTKKGQRHEVEFVSNLYDEEGRKVIQCNIRDITERKHTETALRASEERFRALFHMGPVAVYSCNASGTIEEFNGRAARLWGRRPKRGDTGRRFCGSLQLHSTNGTPMPHDRCPMARVLSDRNEADSAVLASVSCASAAATWPSTLASASLAVSRRPWAAATCMSRADTFTSSALRWATMRSYCASNAASSADTSLICVFSDDTCLLICACREEPLTVVGVAASAGTAPARSTATSATNPPRRITRTTLTTPVTHHGAPEARNGHGARKW